QPDHRGRARSRLPARLPVPVRAAGHISPAALLRLLRLPQREQPRAVVRRRTAGPQRRRLLPDADRGRALRHRQDRGVEEVAMKRWERVLGVLGAAAGVVLLFVGVSVVVVEGRLVPAASYTLVAGLALVIAFVVLDPSAVADLV